MNQFAKQLNVAGLPFLPGISTNMEGMGKLILPLTVVFEIGKDNYD